MPMKGFYDDYVGFPFTAEQLRVRKVLSRIAERAEVYDHLRAVGDNYEAAREARAIARLARSIKAWDVVSCWNGSAWCAERGM